MKTEPKNLTYVGYYRKSSDSEDRQVLSISSQVSEMGEIAREEGISISQSFLESKSAKAQGRAEFNSMLKFIENGKANAIICWKLDRLARNFVDAGKIMDLLGRGVIKKIKTYEREYLQADNVMMPAIEFGMANQYVRDLSVNTKRGQRKKAEMGYPHAAAKLGYLNDKTEEPGNRKWIVDPVRFPLVKQLFELYLTGKYSVRELHEIARDRFKLTTVQRKRQGGKPLTLSYMYVLLADPVNAGFFYNAEQRYELNKELPRIITEDEYWTIQTRLGRKGTPRPKKKSRTGLYNYFMRDKDGLSVTPDFKFQLICDCKHKFSYLNADKCPKCGVAREDMSKPLYLDYIYYYSARERRDKNLKARGIEEKEIDEYVFGYFDDDVAISPELANWCIRNLDELDKKEATDKVAVCESRDRAEAEINKRLNNLLDLRIGRDNISLEEVKIFDDKEATLKSQLKSLRSGQEDKDTKSERLEKLKKHFSQMAGIIETLKNGSKLERKVILMDFGSNLTLKDGKVSICNVKEVQLFVDCLKKLKEEHPTFEPKNLVDLSERNELFVSIRPALLPTLGTFRTRWLRSSGC